MPAHIWNLDESGLQDVFQSRWAVGRLEKHYISYPQSQLHLWKKWNSKNCPLASAQCHGRFGEKHAQFCKISEILFAPKLDKHYVHYLQLKISEIVAMKACRCKGKKGPKLSTNRPSKQNNRTHKDDHLNQWNENNVKNALEKQRSDINWLSERETRD